MWRLLAGQTAISIVINTGIGVVPGAIARIGAAAVAATTVHDLLAGLVPQIVAGSIMSALVPALMTRRQQVSGLLYPGSGRASAPTLLGTAGAALAVGLSFAAIGMGVLAVLARTNGYLGPDTALVAKVACGAVVGLLVTPATLLATLKRP